MSQLIEPNPHEAEHIQATVREAMQTLQRARALGPTAIVAEVLAQWPQTIPVFVRHRMGCVGCSMARFETLADSACIYGLSISQFLDELRQTLPDMARRQNM